MNPNTQHRRYCEWCAGPVSIGRKFCRVLTMPREYNGRKLYFHERCLTKFKDANPNMMRQKEQEALQHA